MGTFYRVYPRGIPGLVRLHHRRIVGALANVFVSPVLIFVV